MFYRDLEVAARVAAICAETGGERPSALRSTLQFALWSVRLVASLAGGRCRRSTKRRPKKVVLLSPGCRLTTGQHVVVCCHEVLHDLEVVARPSRRVVAGEAWRVVVEAWLSYYREVLASAGWPYWDSKEAGARGSRQRAEVSAAVDDFERRRCARLKFFWPGERFLVSGPMSCRGAQTSALSLLADEVPVVAAPLRRGSCRCGTSTSVRRSRFSGVRAASS